MPTLAPPRPRTRNRPLAAWRKAKAVELAVEGHTYDAIARASRGPQVARLDALQAALWPAAMAGDSRLSARSPR